MPRRKLDPEPPHDQLNYKAIVNRLVVRMDAHQEDFQRQLDDLRERLGVVERDQASAKVGIDWDRLS